MAIQPNSGKCNSYWHMHTQTALRQPKKGQWLFGKLTVVTKDVNNNESPMRKARLQSFIWHICKGVTLWVSQHCESKRNKREHNIVKSHPGSVKQSEEVLQGIMCKRKNNIWHTLPFKTPKSVLFSYWAHGETPRHTSIHCRCSITMPHGSLIEKRKTFSSLELIISIKRVSLSLHSCRSL